MWFSQEGLRILKKRIKLKTPRLILCFRIPAVSVAVEDCVLGLLRSSLCVWLCYRDLGVFLSIEQPIFIIQGSLPMTDLTWKGSPEEEESKESEMARFEVRVIILLFVCSVSLSWNALFLDLISSLTSDRVCLNLPIVIIRRDPLPSWHIGVTENRALPAKEAHWSF